jgi:hypothetical protein
VSRLKVAKEGSKYGKIEEARSKAARLVSLAAQ